MASGFEGFNEGGQTTGSESGGSASALQGTTTASGGGGAGGFNDGNSFSSGGEGTVVGAFASFGSLTNGGGVAVASVDQASNVENVQGNASFASEQGSENSFENEFFAEVAPVFLEEEELAALNGTNVTGPFSEFEGSTFSEQEQSSFSESEALAACGPGGRNLQGAPCNAGGFTGGTVDAFTVTDASSGENGGFSGNDAFSFIGSDAGAEVNASEVSGLVIGTKPAGAGVAEGFASIEADSGSEAGSESGVIAESSFFGN